MHVTFETVLLQTQINATLWLTEISYAYVENKRKKADLKCFVSTLKKNERRTNGKGKPKNRWLDAVENCMF